MTLTNEEENRAPDISVEDKVLKDEPGDVEDDKESEGGDTGTLDDDGDDDRDDEGDDDGDDDRDDEDRDDEGNYERDDDGDGEAENCDDDKSVGDIEDEKNLHVQAPWVDESSGEVDQAGGGINVNVTNFTN